MNLEDFKSFRRALKPSEVGSIPTHSRQPSAGDGARHLPGRPVPGAGPRATGFAVAAAFVLVASSVAAGEEAVASRPTIDPFQDGPTAFQRAARSAVIPAWGQITNGKSRKGTILFVVQTYLYTRIAIETREAHEAKRWKESLERSGAEAAEIDVAQDWAQEHFDTRRNLFFWAILAGFYGAVDAYIDANLGDFEKDLEDGRALFGNVDAAERSVEVGVKF